MRSLNTSITALLPIISLLDRRLAHPRGRPRSQEFGLALFIGLLSGAYSSIFIASPVLALLKEREPRYRALRKRLEERDAATGRAATSRPSWPRRGERRPATVDAGRRRRPTAGRRSAGGPGRRRRRRDPAPTRPTTRPGRARRASGAERDGRRGLAALIRDIPDFPKPGVVFKDITPAARPTPTRSGSTVDALADHFAAPAGRPGARHRGPRASSSPRRSPTGSAPASCRCARPASCPWEIEREEYELEYGTDLLEIHRDAVAAGRAGADRRRRARHRRHRGGHRPAGRAARRRRSSASRS